MFEIIAQVYGNGIQAPLVILVDEYDTPLHNVSEKRENIELIANQLIIFLRRIFKDHGLLYRGVVTGIESFPLQTFYLGFNNAKVNTILHNVLNDSYGLTSAELATLYINCVEKGNPEKLQGFIEHMKYYNGYLTPQGTVYNIWSVLSYVNENLQELRKGEEDFPPCKPFSMDTSRNIRLIKSLTAAMETNGLIFKDFLRFCNQEVEDVQKEIKRMLSPDDLLEDHENIWTLLFFHGYITLGDPEPVDAENNIGKLRIPNTEMAFAMRELLNTACKDGKIQPETPKRKIPLDFNL